MSVLDSLLVALFVIGIVFVILIVLIYLVKIKSITFNFVDRKKDEQLSTEETPSISGHGYGYSSVQNSSEMSKGELKLIGVDEKTAAIAMAIVCDELKVPLCELQFLSIKSLD